MKTTAIKGIIAEAGSSSKMSHNKNMKNWKEYANVLEEKTINLEEVDLNQIEFMFYNIIFNFLEEKISWSRPSKCLITSVKNIHLFVLSLERIQASGKRTIEDKNVFVTRINCFKRSGTLIQNISHGIMHVIFHEMFDYKICQHTLSMKDNIPNEHFGVSLRTHICYNSIYLDEDDELLKSIQRELHANEHLFKVLRSEVIQYEKEPKKTMYIPAFCCIRGGNLLIEYLIINIVKKRGIKERGILILTPSSTSLISKLTENIRKHFKALELSNFTTRHNFRVRHRVQHLSQQENDKLICQIGRHLVHIVIHEFIEKSSCNNIQESSRNISGICTDTVYWECNKHIFDDILEGLAVIETKLNSQMGRHELEQDSSNTALVQTQDCLNTHCRKMLIELFRNYVEKESNFITTNSSIVNNASTVLRSFLQHLDDRVMDAETWSTVINRIAQMDEEVANIAVDTTKISAGKFLWLCKSIMHFVLHNMYEHTECRGTTSLENCDGPLSLKPYLCNNDIYHESNNEILLEIIVCLRTMKNNFKTLEYRHFSSRRPNSHIRENSVPTMYKGLDLNQRLTNVILLIPHIQYNDCLELVADMLKHAVFLETRNTQDFQETLNHLSGKIIHNIQQWSSHSENIITDLPHNAMKNNEDSDTKTTGKYHYRHRHLGIENRVNKMPFGKLLLQGVRHVLHVIVHELLDNTECANTMESYYAPTVNNLKSLICQDVIYQPHSMNVLRNVRKVIYYAEFKLGETKLADKDPAIEKRNELKNIFSDMLYKMISIKYPHICRVKFNEIVSTVSMAIAEYVLTDFNKISLPEVLGHKHLLFFTALKSDKKDNAVRVRGPKEKFVVRIAKELIHIMMHDMFEYSECRGSRRDGDSEEICQDLLYTQQQTPFDNVEILRDLLKEVEDKLPGLKFKSELMTTHECLLSIKQEVTEQSEAFQKPETKNPEPGMCKKLRVKENLTCKSEEKIENSNRCMEKRQLETIEEEDELVNRKKKFKRNLQTGSKDNLF